MDSESLYAANERVNAARATLRCRLAALEDRVTGTIDSARETVTSTVDDTTSKVRELVDTTSCTVKDALDVSQHIRDNPWQGAGLAVFAGFIAGIFSRGVKLPAINLAETARSIASSSSPTASKSWNPLRELAEKAREELMKVSQQAIVNLSNTVQQNVDSMAKTVVNAGAERLRSQSKILQSNGRHSMN